MSMALQGGVMGKGIIEIFIAVMLAAGQAFS